MAQTLKKEISEAMKSAMRAKEKSRLAAIRLILSEIKRIEVDERIEVDDERVLAVLDKMCKQRRDSIAEYKKANRTDLIAAETAELTILEQYLPAQLSEEQIREKARAVINELGITDVKGMGQVMQRLMADLQGQADGKIVSTVVRQLLSA